MGEVEKRYDFFISYCHEDRDLAQELATQLERQKRTVWWDRALIAESGPWRDAVADAILDSRAIVLILTQLAASRDEVKKELQFARYKHTDVLPLFVDNPEPKKGSAGIFQDLSIYQHIYVDGRSIDTWTVEQCIQRLEGTKNVTVHGAAAGVVEDRTPGLKLKLESLVFGDNDFPSPSGFTEGVLAACYSYFVDRARGADWDSVTRLLDDMTTRKLFPRRVAQFAALRCWLAWVTWYEKIQLREPSWKGLVQELELQQRQSSSDPLTSACPPVAERLKNAFWLGLTESFEAFLNHLDFGPGDGGSWSHAIERLEMLQPELLAPLAGQTDDIVILRRENAEFLEWAKQALIAYSQVEDCAINVGELGREPFPPVDARALKARWKEQQKRDEAIRLFLSLLFKIAPQCGGQEGAVMEILKRFELVGITGESGPATMEFEQKLALLEEWGEILTALFSAGLGDEKRDGLIKRLDRVGEQFAAAAEQARRLRVCREQWQAHETYRSRLIDGVAWKEPPGEMPDLAATLEQLHTHLAIPWLAKLEISPEASKQRVARIRAWIEELDRERSHAIREVRIVGALRSLRILAAKNALEELKELTAEGILTASDASPCIRVCEAFLRLESVLKSVLKLTIDDAARGAFEQEHLETPAKELKKLSQHCKEVSNSLSTARGEEALLKSFDVPMLDSIVGHLTALEKDRRLWAQIKTALKGTELAEAYSMLEDLAKRFDSASEALDVVRSWLEAEKTTDSWRASMSRQEWQAALEEIEAVRGKYEETRQKVATFGKAALSAVLKKRFAELSEEQARCRLALEDEARLQQALVLLRSDRVLEALDLFTKMKAELDSVRFWRDVIETMLRLISLLRPKKPVEKEIDVDRLVQEARGAVPTQVRLVDQDTGLPRAEQPNLDTVRTRLVALESAALEVENLLERAQEETRFSCTLGLPGRLRKTINKSLVELDCLERYLRQAKVIQEQIEDSEWQSAHERLNDLPMEVVGSSVLRAAVETGRAVHATLESKPGKEQLDELCHKRLSHPILEPLLQECQNLRAEARFTIMAEAAKQLCEECANDNTATDLREYLRRPLVADRGQLKSLARALKVSRKLRAEDAAARLIKSASANRVALLAAMGEVEQVVAALHPERDALPHNVAVAVFSRLEKKGQQTDRNLLSVTISTCALFACCSSYRNVIVPSGLNARSLRTAVGRELKHLLVAAAVEWGETTDTAAWAYLWEAECSAVSELPFTAGQGPLAWPFGPALIGFFGLEEELSEILDNDPRSRVWYGPCAGPKVMLASGEPEAALASLADVETQASEVIHDAPGYRHSADPEEALRQDVNQVRSDVWDFKLRRCRFLSETTSAQADEIGRNLIVCCAKLLELDEADAEVTSRLGLTLRRIFQHMQDQIAKPQEHLGRPATLHDGKARKRCMDGVVEFLQQRASDELSALIPGLQALRAKLLVELSDIAFEAWQQNQRQELLDEMIELTEQAVRDSPNDSRAHVAQGESVLLRAVADGTGAGIPAARANLEGLKLQAARRHWPRGAIQHITELCEMSQSADAYEMWIRQRRLKASPGRTNDG